MSTLDNELANFQRKFPGMQWRIKYTRLGGGCKSEFIEGRCGKLRILGNWQWRSGRGVRFVVSMLVDNCGGTLFEVSCKRSRQSIQGAAQKTRTMIGALAETLMREQPDA